MLIYSKVVDGVNKLFGTTSDIPSVNDNELVYKDFDGDEVTLVANDVYVDNSSDGVQRVRRLSDGKALTVYIKTANNELVKVLGNDPVLPKVVKRIKVSGPDKKTYTSGEELDLTGLEVKAVYEDGDEVVITEGYTVDPAAGTAITEDTTCTVTHTESSKTATFKVKIAE